MVQDFDVLSFGDSFNHLPHDDAASSSAGTPKYGLVVITPFIPYERNK